MFESIPISPIQPITLPGLDQETLAIQMLREDLLHTDVSGNKWRKLKYNFLEMQQRGLDQLVTFGGAFSNHIAATAACAQHHGFKSVGIIRGQELSEDANPTLRFAANCGMKLIFVDRQAYRAKESPDFLAKYLEDAQSYYPIPEGGSNELAVQGAAEILGSHTAAFNYICVSAGTGGTAAGIIRSAEEHQQVLVFPALKGDFMQAEINSLLGHNFNSKCKWSMITDYHFGGYAKWNRQLIDFINNFKGANRIAVDHIYNGKMLFGLHDLVKNGYFSPETSILVIHTGGTQSIVGFNEINGLLIK